MPLPTSRVRNHVVETAILTYQNTSRITTVGLYHIGDPAYYDMVSERFSRSHVGYESVKGPELLPGHPLYERQEMGRRILQIYSRIAHLLGVTSQDWLRKGDDWTNVDLDIETVVSGMNDADVREMGLIVGHMENALSFASSSSFAQQELVRSIRRDMLRVAAAGNLQAMDSLLVGRDANAAAWALEQHRDTVLLYGVAHLPGIDRHLRDAGYALISEEWLPALNFKNSL